MLQHEACNRDAELASVGKVRQAHPARLVLLPEHHILLRTMLGPPRRDAPFQRPPDVRVQVRVSPLHLSQHADDADARRGNKDRHNFCLPDRGQRVRSSSPARRLLL